MKSLSRILLAAAALLSAAAPALAQGAGFPAGPDSPVTIRATVVPPRAAPGEKVTVRVTAEIAPGYHIYGLPPVPELTYPTTLTVEAPAGLSPEGKVRGPAPLLRADPTLGGEEVPWYRGTVVLEQDLRVAADAAAGERSLLVRLDQMACTEEFCLDPSTLEARAGLVVAAAPRGTAAAPSPGSGAAPERAEATLWGLWAAAFLGGLFSVLLPCVYPLVPLTLAFFSKHEGSRARAVGRAVLFCTGILLTFTVLGVLVGGSLQVIAASLWLNLFLLLLMAALALSLLGMFDIALPSAWTDRMQALGSGASALSPVFMGIAFSLASFTCTVGVIGPLLAASSTEVGRAATGMFAYSLGFAVPFFALALFPVALSAMPKSGGWLNTLKVLLGLFEICFAGYYLWRTDLVLGWGVGTFPIVLSLWTATALLAGLYLLGKVRLPHDSPRESVSVPRAVGAILAFAAAFYLLGGLLNQVRLPAWMQGLLPPRRAGFAAAGSAAEGGAAVPLSPRPSYAGATFHPGFGGLWWTTDYDRALEIGRRTGRRVFLNFTGIFCSNCRTMEQGLFLRPAIRAALGEMVLAELWTDIPTEAAAERFATHTTVAESRRYRELRRAPKPRGYATTANPHYVILSPEGRILAESGYEADEGAFLEFLRP